MSYQIKAPVRAGRLRRAMTDDEIHEALKRAPNGSYAFYVCRKCGAYRTHIEAGQAKILDSCEECEE